jgi:hypothetical protein
VPLVAPAGIAQLPEQQSPFKVQLPPAWAHVGLHVPLVAPAGMAQSPEQQSLLTVQLPPAATHEGGLHAPLVAPGGRSHVSPAQHSTLTVQLTPGRPHRTGGVATHACLPWPPVGRQVEPAQQLVSAVPVHRAPSARQAKHRRISSRSATHRPFSQHCSLNWQTSPCGMHIQSGGDAQAPLSQTPAQHSAFCRQGSPFGRHIGAGGQPRVQVPFTHAVPLQQGSPFAHDPLASTHAGAAHTPVEGSQVRPTQQSEPPVHACPATPHTASAPLDASEVLQDVAPSDRAKTSGSTRRLKAACVMAAPPREPTRIPPRAHGG